MTGTGRNQRGAALILVVMVLASAIVIIAYAAFSRHAGIGRQQTLSVKRADALNAARSGADLALALARTDSLDRTPLRGNLDQAAFHVSVQDGRIVSRGIVHCGKRRVEAAVTVHFERTANGVVVREWAEE